MGTVYVSQQKVVETPLPDEFESMGVFVKLVEEARRLRSVLLDSGDESARLKVSGAGAQGGGGGSGGSNNQVAAGGKGGGKGWGKAAWGVGGGGNRSGPY